MSVHERPILFNGAMVDLKAADQPLEEPLSAELVSLRVVPAGVSTNEANKASVRLFSDSEERQFSASCSLETARAIGQHLRKELLADLYLERNDEGLIRNAEIESFDTLTDGDGAAVWRQSFHSKIQEWDEIDDLDEYLGRD